MLLKSNSNTSVNSINLVSGRFNFKHDFGESRRINCELRNISASGRQYPKTGKYYPSKQSKNCDSNKLHSRNTRGKKYGNHLIQAPKPKTIQNKDGDT